MQQFVVPQFIDVEDKIIGPITTRQFITMLFGAVIIFVLYRILSFGFFLLFGLTIAGATIAFAFVRMNGQPFHLFLLNRDFYIPVQTKYTIHQASKALGLISAVKAQVTSTRLKSPAEAGHSSMLKTWRQIKIYTCTRQFF